MIFLVLFSFGILIGSLCIFKFLRFRQELRMFNRMKAWEKRKTLNEKGDVSYSF